MTSFAAIAKAHDIFLPHLHHALAMKGWDFSALTAVDHDQALDDFTNRLVNSYAAKVAATFAERAARDAKIASNRDAMLTAAAKANPAAQCGRCNGQGRIRGFSHVDGGRCFACSGKGIRCAR